MKKSQLNKIIKNSIREIKLNEQYVPGTPGGGTTGTMHTVKLVACTSTGGGGNVIQGPFDLGVSNAPAIGSVFELVSTATQGPQAGDIVFVAPSPNSSMVPPTLPPNLSATFTNSPCPGNWAATTTGGPIDPPRGTAIPNDPNIGFKKGINQDAIKTIREAINEQPWPGQYWQYNIGACYDWGHNWAATQPFTNPSNPNNPCNHICSRITHWTNLLQTISDPKRGSRLKCKITHGWAQYSTHGCAGVNSNFCPL